MGNNVKKLQRDEIGKYYDIKNKLGHGSFAVVKMAVRKEDNAAFAIKIIKKSKLNPEELAVVHDEVEIMHKIEHPNCVKLYDIFETPKKLYMVMELLTGGELFDRIVQKGSFNEREAATLIRDLTGAIKYLHSIGVVHRDLKPENLIYLNNKPDSPIKITDFGLAKFRGGEKAAQHSAMTTACGTPGYVAPEVLKSEPYGPEVDMWSLGVILYILLCGFPPFYHEQTAKLYQQIKAGAYDFPPAYWDEISKDAKDLVKRLLTVDPKRRITPEQVLQHPWVKNCGEAPEKKMGAKFLQNLQLLQARRKLRAGIQLVLALNKFKSLLHESSEEAQAPVEAKA